MTSQDSVLDFARRDRIGLDEAIFCAHKSTTQIQDILAKILAAKRAALLTRLRPDQVTALSGAHRERLDYDEASATAYFNWAPPSPSPPRLSILTGGTSDNAVAREAQRTLAFSGVTAASFFDVGVAGLWRLQDRLEEIRELPIALVVAGMDAALPTVLGGLYGGTIIAVPSSVGYGVAAGGHTALNAILASCASGIVTVNIDNGYGAACAALRVLSSGN